MVRTKNNMKKILLLLILLLWFSFGKSQQYAKMLDSTTWSTMTTNFGITWYRWSLPQGDTIINSLTYKKYGNFNLREDTLQRKVYAISQFRTYEYLLYDFNLALGDSICIYTVNDSDFATVTVKDSVLSYQGYRKRWILQGVFNSLSYTSTIVEGVGSLEEPLIVADLTFIQDPVHINFCFYHNGQPYFNNTIFQNCPVYGQNTLLTTPTSCNSCTGAVSVFLATPNPDVYQYNWGTTPPQYNYMATGLCAAYYTITVQDGNSNIIYQNVVSPGTNNNLTITDSITPPSCSNCNDGQITVFPSGGSPPFYYYWSPGGQTTATVTGLPPGCYSVYAYNSVGCSVIDTFCLSFISGAETYSINDFVIYPNPSSGAFTIYFSEEAHEIDIADCSGQLVFRCALESNELEINQSFSPGLYFLRIIGDKGISTKKIIIQ